MKKVSQRLLNELGDFFRDDKGNMSMTRLMALGLVVGGLCYAFLHKDPFGGLAFSGLGFTGKVAQKRLSERKSIKN